ncbi:MULTISPECIES: ABC transporter ATP-binding protein [unclassified Geodermatophilus]|uniref:ABC transporter ATP-binding protein n=1 Tax=unclassified Geodermatophilus TaxID=2637632 RepID=UPI003EEC22F4
MTEAALSCRGVSPRYGSITVARDVDLELAPGEVLALLGPNGAGKSSVVECLAGRVAGRGEVTVGGRRVDRLPAFRRARAGLALVPENRGLFPDLSVADNLRLGGMLDRSGASSIDAALELFPVLRNRWTQPAGTLSGGEQQMLAIARAIVAAPTVLVLDEPTQGLAPRIYDVIVAALEVLRDRGLAVLLVEQNVGFAAEIADRYCVMSAGRMVDIGPGSRLRGDADALFELFMAG